MGVAAMFAGAGLSAGSSIQSGRFNERVANTNAGFAEMQAIDAEKRGIEDEANMRVRIRQQIGQARAAYASQNVQVGVGSAGETEASIAYMGEKDAITIRNNAAREAWGYRVQAWNYRQKGAMAKSESQTRALGTVLGAASDYYKLKR